MRRSGLLLALVVLLSVAALAIGMIAQIQWNMQPCPWCTLQRLVYALVGLAALVAWMASRAYGVSIAGALLSAGLALAGLAAALYQHLVASHTESCALTLADKIIGALGLDDALPAVFKATAACDKANIALAGVPFAIWSAMLFALLAVLSMMALAAIERPSTRQLFR